MEHSKALHNTDALCYALLNWGDNNYTMRFDGDIVYITNLNTQKVSMIDKETDEALFDFVRYIMGVNKYGLLSSEQHIADLLNISLAKVRNMEYFKGLEGKKLGNQKRSAKRYPIQTLIDIADKNAAELYRRKKGDKE